jgi:hypothetical protein
LGEGPLTLVLGKRHWGSGPLLCPGPLCTRLGLPVRRGGQGPDRQGHGQHSHGLLTEVSTTTVSTATRSGLAADVSREQVAG